MRTVDVWTEGDILEAEEGNACLCRSCPTDSWLMTIRRETMRLITALLLLTPFAAALRPAQGDTLLSDTFDSWD